MTKQEITSHPGLWVIGLSYLGLACFIALEREAIAKAFEALLPPLPGGPLTGSWALVAVCVILGILIIGGLLGESWASRLTRWVLGLVFLAAALPKIIDPAGFSMDIRHYDILPLILVNGLAIVLPWMEAVMALALICGLMRDGAVLLANLMLLLFMGGLVQAYARGLDINCGCFGHGTAASEPIAKAIVRDVFFLGWSIPLFFTERKKSF